MLNLWQMNELKLALTLSRPVRWYISMVVMKLAAYPQNKPTNYASHGLKKARQQGLGGVPHVPCQIEQMQA